MIRIDKEEVIESLNLRKFGSQNWYQNKNIQCPWCQKNGDKVGILFTEDNSGLVHCLRCGTKTSLYNYLKKIDRLDLVKGDYENSIKIKLTALVKEEVKEEDTPIKKVPLPRKLVSLVNDPYLASRGFTDYHYKEYEPSETKFFLEKDLWNYTIFKLKMNGEVVAWLARSRYSKEWHKQNLKEAKEKGIKPLLRYENSRTDFTKLLGGYDNITDKTETLFLVEGLFDSVGVDNLLRTYDDESIRCCFLFGNSVSEKQIELIKKKPSVKTIILMLDDSTVPQSKAAGLLLAKHFDTKIAHLTRPGVDPNDMDLDYLIEVLDKLEDPINFYVDKIPQRW